MIVMSDGESDIDGIACEERQFLESLGHVPAQSVENNFGSEIGSQLPVLSFQWASLRFGDCSRSFGAPNRSAVGMAAWRREDCGCGKFG